jgi:5-methylcytosine-specific restriction endonuclease McrA
MATWEKLRAEVIKRDSYTCHRCGKRTLAGLLTVHPMTISGGMHPDNLVSLCQPCYDYVRLHKLFSLDTIKASYDESEADSDWHRRSRKPKHTPWQGTIVDMLDRQRCYDKL